MSSLSQFSGQTGRRGVRLEFILVDSTRDWRMSDVEPRVPCNICQKDHAQIRVAWRKPRGMSGCWVVFRYNGADHAPDLSVPINVEQLPRDAEPLSPEENSRSWHS